MDTKRKGDVAELNVLAKLTEMGVDISEPYGEDTRYDFIADINGALVKLQVKNGVYKNGKICASLQSTRYNSNGSSTVSYSKDNVDVFVIYSPYTDGVYWVPFDGAPKTGIELRVEEAEQKSSLINWASDYRLNEDQTV